MISAKGIAKNVAARLARLEAGINMRYFQKNLNLAQTIKANVAKKSTGSLFAQDGAKKKPLNSSMVSCPKNS